MKIYVGQHELTITKNEVNEKEINITKCEFEFDEAITNDFVKDVYFTLYGKTYQITNMQNDECYIPTEVLNKNGLVELGVVAYLIEDGEYVKRYNPTSVFFPSKRGSLKDKYENAEQITPTDKEQIEQDIKDMQEQVDNLNIEAEKVGGTTTITITRKDGTQEETDVQDGVSLENIKISNRDLYVTYGGVESDLGQVAPNIQIGTTTTGTPSTQASVVNVGTDLNPILNFTIPKGEAGSIKFEIVEQLPTEDIKEDTIYLVPYTKITVQTLPTENIQLHTIYIVESTGKRYVYNGNEWIEISSDNQYIEYIYINNSWEELGSIGVDINLDDYYTKTETNTLLEGKVGFTDYASPTNYDVVKMSRPQGFSGISVSNGAIEVNSGGTTLINNRNDGNPNNKTYRNIALTYSFIDYALKKSISTNTETLTSEEKASATTWLGAENSTNKVTSISSSSTDTEYPSAKCVYDLVGDISSALDTINGEVI